MNTETIKGKALSFVLMKPNRFRLNAGYPLVIFLHGFGASMYDLVGIASGLEDRGYVYACVNAPHRVKLGFGYGGHSWLPGREGVEPAPEGTRDLEELLDVCVQEAREQVGVEEGNILLAGFDQGGEVALRYGLTRPHVFRALACVGGSVNADDLRHRLPEDRSQPILLLQTNIDKQELEPARATRHFLESAGYQLVYREYEAAPQLPVAPGIEENAEEEYDMAPAAPHPELRDLISWIKETLPPH